MVQKRRKVNCQNCGHKTTMRWDTNRILKRCSHCIKLFSDSEVDILVKKYL